MCEGEYNNSNRGVGEPPSGVMRGMNILENTLCKSILIGITAFSL